MALYLGLLSDELTNYAKSNTSYIELYTNSMNANLNIGPWASGYSYIYQANAIIAALQNNSALSPQIVNQLLGEAQFFRAFWYFYLTNLYGNVPNVISTDYETNATIARTDKSKIYQQIVIDLKSAQSLMSTNFISANDTTITTTARTRPNKWAAAALLARVYLFTGDNVDAEAEADSVINNTSLFNLVHNLNNVFLVNSNEAIWQLDIPQPSNYNTPDGQQFILTSAPGGSSNCCALAPELLNAFEPNDMRRANWVDSVKTPSMIYYYPYKYKVQAGTKVTEDVMVLRLGEQYLIRAEAKAQQGNFSGAINDLDSIRNRAGLGGYNGPNNQQSILTAIQHERQVELFTEWGHRWLDLIRLNYADSVMSIVTLSKGGNWNPDNHQALFPIPKSEITVDGNLTQNLGY